MPPAAGTRRHRDVLRIACSLLVLATAMSAAWMVSRLSSFGEIFESMMIGGVEALPVLPRWLIISENLLFGFTLVLAGAALGVIWKARKETWVGITSALVAVVFLGMAILIPEIVQQSLIEIVNQIRR